MLTMTSMVKRSVPKRPKRAGTAFWLADKDGDLLRALAAAEDRTLQTILSRALRAYAGNKPGIQEPTNMTDQTTGLRAATTAFPIPEATLAVECWMTNPLRPGAIAVSVDGKLMATVRLDQFKATAARLAELERELQERQP